MFIDRRGFLKSAGAAAATGLISVDAHSQGKAVVNMQLGWLLGGNQIGEVVAKRLGYYEQEGIDLRIQPGGPNIDGVAIVASGRFETGADLVEPVDDAGGLAGLADQVLRGRRCSSTLTRSSR